MHTCLSSQSYFKVRHECVSSWSPAVVRLALAGLRGCSPCTWELAVAFYSPFHPLTPPVLFPATWSSHIYHSQLNRQKAAGKCRGRETIIHVAQSLMQICLLTKAFWATRICLMAMLYMSATWPWCPVALSMRSWVRFSVLLSVLFLWYGQKTLNWVGGLVSYISVLSDLLWLDIEKYTRAAVNYFFPLLIESSRLAWHFFLIIWLFYKMSENNNKCPSHSLRAK